MKSTMNHNEVVLWFTIKCRSTSYWWI